MDGLNLYVIDWLIDEGIGRTSRVCAGCILAPLLPRDLFIQLGLHRQEVGQDQYRSGEGLILEGNCLACLVYKKMLLLCSPKTCERSNVLLKENSKSSLLNAHLTQSQMFSTLESFKNKKSWLKNTKLWNIVFERQILQTLGLLLQNMPFQYRIYPLHMINIIFLPFFTSVADPDWLYPDPDP